MAVSSCRITDSSLELLTTLCKNLKSLYIGECNLISEVGYFMISNNCKNLEVLDLSFSVIIHENGFKAILNNCKKCIYNNNNNNNN